MSDENNKLVVTAESSVEMDNESVVSAESTVDMVNNEPVVNTESTINPNEVTVETESMTTTVDECRTPRGIEHEIPPILDCPPAPMAPKTRHLR